MKPNIAKTWVAAFAVAIVGTGMSTAVPRLSVGTVRGFPGNTVEVPLSLAYATNDLRNVVALQADVVLETGTVNAGAPVSGLALNGHVLRSSAPVGVLQRVLTYSLNNAVVSNGTVATLPLAVPAGAFQNVRLRLENVILSAADGSQVPATATPGGIAINPVYVRPSGDVDGFLTVTTNASEACYIVQATTDFQSWVNVFTNNSAGSLLQFCDLQGGTYPHRFYRALRCDVINGVRIDKIGRLADGRVQFEFNGVASLTYRVQASTNLEEWLPLATLPGSNGVIHFIDPGSTNFPQRFYRLEPQ